MSESTSDLETQAGDDLLAELADDFLRRYRAGEQPAVDEYAAKHPELADRIRGLFPAVLVMEQPGPGATMDLTPPTERVGAIIGRYKLLERIGEGGFGIVYMAEQQHPVRRKVALKVIKPGLDTRQVIARFEAERQALALMEHQNIARVFDAGSTDAGRPYFVMELVRGAPVTEYCDENELSARERLELFVQVCRAVQHAHTKGIIHRDIKPSNVLVTLHEGVPVPKVIDFGVAKATGQQLTERTLFTNFAQMVGTPLYMSPEQAEMTSVDIDTRSDVYSLGVLLYELLTGTTPLDKERFKQAAFDEVRRIIRDEEPPRPSARRSTLGGQARRGISAQRKSDPKQFGRIVRGELDWIVMKALAKERARRYETADALARDVERYLLDQSVEACPPSTVYLFKKFARRNRGPLLAAAVVLLTLIGGIVGTTIGLVRAEQARRAQAERAEGERLAKEEAQTRLVQIEKGTELLASVFRDMDPMVADNAGVTFRDLLRRRLAEAAQQLEGEAVGDPLVVARLQHVLGISLTELGLREQAAEVLVEAARTRERLLGANHLDTAATKHYLAMAYRDDGEYALAEPLYKEALAIRTAKLGVDHPDTLTSKHYLGMLYSSAGQYVQAETLLKEVLAIRTAKFGAGYVDTVATQHRLAMVYQSQAKYALAESLLKEVLAIRAAKLGDDHLDTVAAKSGLARLYHNEWKLSLAEPLLKDALAIRTAKLGTDHPDTLTSKRHLAMLYRSMEKFELAIPLMEESLKRSRANEQLSTLAQLYCDAGRFADAIPLFEEIHRKDATFAGVRDGLLSAYLRAGKMSNAAAAAAAPQYEEALATRTATLGSDHPDTIQSRDNLALLYRPLKKFDQSISLLEESLRIRKAQLGPDHPELLGRQVTLGAYYCDAGRFADGITLIEEVRRKGRDDPHPMWVSSVLVTAYVQAGKSNEAVALVAERVREFRAELPADSPELAARLADAGKALIDVRAYAAAEPLLRDSLSIRERIALDATTHHVQSVLGGALVGQKKYAEAEPLLLSGFEGLRRTQTLVEPQVEDLRVREALERLVHLYEGWGQPDKAAPWRRQLVSGAHRTAESEGL